MKIKNIKEFYLSKFKNININETFLDKDNLIHYY